MFDEAVWWARLQRPLKGAEKQLSLRRDYEERNVSISRSPCKRP